MKSNTVTTHDILLYESEIHSDQDWDNNVVEDEWWVAHAPDLYEKYYYAQKPRAEHDVEDPPPTYTPDNARIVDQLTRFLVTINNSPEVIVNKIISVGPGGYPAIQPGLLCNQDKAFWPTDQPCCHILAIQQIISPPTSGTHPFSRTGR